MLLESRIINEVDTKLVRLDILCSQTFSSTFPKKQKPPPKRWPAPAKPKSGRGFMYIIYVAKEKSIAFGIYNQNSNAAILNLDTNAIL